MKWYQPIGYLRTRVCLTQDWKQTTIYELCVLLDVHLLVNLLQLLHTYFRCEPYSVNVPNVLFQRLTTHIFLFSVAVGPNTVVLT